MNSLFATLNFALVDNGNNMFGTMFKITSGQTLTVTSDNNLYSGISYSNIGGVFSLTSTYFSVQFTDVNSIFRCKQ